MFSVGLNYNFLNHHKSQNLPEYLSLNFAINIISKKVMENEKLLDKKVFYHRH